MVRRSTRITEYTARGYLLSFLGSLRFGRFGGEFLGHRNLNPFKDGTLSRVTLALIHFDDASVATRPGLKCGCQFFEQDTHNVFLRPPFLSVSLAPVQGPGLLAKPGSSKATGVESPAFAKGDELFGDRPCGAGLGEGGGDSFMFDEAADEIGKHRIAMRSRAPEFGGVFEMAHGERVLFGDRFFLGRFEQSGIQVHAEAQAEGSELVLDLVQ
jgi:hypothetical protein